MLDPVPLVYFGQFCNLPAALAKWFPQLSLDECWTAAQLPQPGPPKPVRGWH